MGGVEFSFQLTGAGWAKGRVADDGRWFAPTASYLSDALGELLLALAALQEGAEYAKAQWDEEPGEYRWVFIRAGRRVSLRLLSFVDLWSELPDDDGEVVFDTEADIDELIRAFVTGCRRVIEDLGEEEYLNRWMEHPFPTRLLDAVESRLGHLR